MSKGKNKIFTLGLVCVAAFSAGATTPMEVLEQVVNSTQLENLREQNKAALATEEAQNYLPGLEVDFEHLWHSARDTKWSLSVTQSFDWPGLYTTRRDLIAANRAVNSLGEESLRMELRVAAMKILVELSYNAQRIKLLDRELESLMEIDKYLAEALEHRVVTILDKKKSAIEIVNVTIEKDKLLARQDELLGELQQLAGFPLNLKDVNWIDLPPLQTLGEYETYLGEVDLDPSLRAETQRNEVARLEAETARLSVLPKFGIGYRHDKEDIGHFDGFSMSVGLPTWGVTKQKIAAQTALATQNVQAENRKKLILARIENEYRSAQTLREHIKKLRANGVDGSYLILLGEALKGGELTMMDYLREQIFYRTTSMTLLDLEEKYSLLLASLNRYRLK